jgi:hypothetical protein
MAVPGGQLLLSVPCDALLSRYNRGTTAFAMETSTGFVADPIGAATIPMANSVRTNGLDGCTCRQYAAVAARVKIALRHLHSRVKSRSSLLSTSSPFPLSTNVKPTVRNPMAPPPGPMTTSCRRNLVVDG